ncbi:acyltransferase family protein [Runella sp.]|uniref:acyltransferase family protein n=1 Tax=Runella sp. TaxID=1960881 RepID=UPI003D112D0B
MQLLSERRHYIDWIRVLAFFLLIFFHCAMPFVTFGWEVKNAETSVGLSRLIYWLHQWRLPLLFFISGVGIYFSLQRRSVGMFAGERIVRLFIPLLFGMFFLTPAQVYIERLQRGQFRGSYAEFYPTVWELVPYPDGTLTWSHLWFVVYLFVFCLLLLPIFALFKLKAVNTWKEKITDRLTNPVVLGALVIPFTFYYFTLYLDYPEQQSLFNDWFLFVSSITLVLYGYLLGGSNTFWKTCEQFRLYYLGTAIICIALLFYGYWWALELPKINDNRLYIYGILNSVHIWTLILALIGFAKKYLNFSTPFLTYTNQAVYPYYILHQTVIVVAGYFVVQWSLPIAVKLLLLICICFLVIAMLYHWLIKPFILTRILFGLKPKETNKKRERAIVTP